MLNTHRVSNNPIYLDQVWFSVVKNISSLYNPSSLKNVSFEKKPLQRMWLHFHHEPYITILRWVNITHNPQGQK